MDGDPAKTPGIAAGRTRSQTYRAQTRRVRDRSRRETRDATRETTGPAQHVSAAGLPASYKSAYPPSRRDCGNKSLKRLTGGFLQTTGHVDGGWSDAFTTCLSTRSSLEMAPAMVRSNDAWHASSGPERPVEGGSPSCQRNGIGTDEPLDRVLAKRVWKLLRCMPIARLHSITGPFHHGSSTRGQVVSKALPRHPDSTTMAI